MNTPVNFPIAKLLKEKDFVMPTFYYYENHKLVEPYLENGSSTDTEFRVDLSDLKEHFNKHSKKVSAPTIAEVVMWLYEKHGIWISADPDNDTDLWFHTISYNKSEVVFGNYNGPIEAYEGAIEHVLTHLI